MIEKLPVYILETIDFKNNPTIEPKIHWQIIVNIFYNLNGLQERCDGGGVKNFICFILTFGFLFQTDGLCFWSAKMYFDLIAERMEGSTIFLTHTGCGGRGLEEQFFLEDIPTQLDGL